MSEVIQLPENKLYICYSKILVKMIVIHEDVFFGKIKTGLIYLKN